MFTRIVTVRTKSGKMKELTNTVSEKVLPILRKQPGFVDEITLVSSTEPERMVSLSFWNTEADAQRYQRDNYSTVNQIVDPYLQNPPSIETYDVDQSTIHKIVRGKAA